MTYACEQNQGVNAIIGCIGREEKVSFNFAWVHFKINTNRGILHYVNAIYWSLSLISMAQYFSRKQQS